MTRKHFELIAEALAASRPTETGPARAQWNLDVVTVASACKVANPNFDYDRFYQATGYHEAGA